MKTEKKQQLKARLQQLDRDQVEDALIECVEELIISESVSYYPEWAADNEDHGVDYTIPYWSESGENLIKMV